MTLFAPQCVTCARLTSTSGNWTCQAFARGIPREILMREADHTKPYPGDGGLRYKPKPGSESVEQ